MAKHPVKRRVPSCLLLENSDPIRSAKASGLQYVSDQSPGITRKRQGNRFYYITPTGKPLRTRAELRRIESLAIPPAWTDVWICPSPNGHLQAAGRDAKGRKQYRYHPRWREARDETKYDRMLPFGNVLAEIRACVDRDLGLPGLPRPKVIATVVKLLETTLIRVGNEEYARDNHSFGLTTMRARHVEVNGSQIHFAFRGKSGVKFELDVRDRRLARIVKRCQDLPGQELFQYFDNSGELRVISSTDVNEYLREITEQEFTAKDFRTWAATVLAAQFLRAAHPCRSRGQAKRNVIAAIDCAAAKLGNTRAVCRKCYIHPAIIESYLEGTLSGVSSDGEKQDVTGANGKLGSEEALVMAVIRRHREHEPDAGSMRERRAVG